MCIHYYVHACVQIVLLIIGFLKEVKRSIDIFEETQKTLVQATPFQR